MKTFQSPIQKEMYADDDGCEHPEIIVRYPGGKQFRVTKFSVLAADDFGAIALKIHGGTPSEWFIMGLRDKDKL